MEKKSCGCETHSKEKFNAGLRKNAEKIVSTVEGYSKADRTKRGADVKAAFPAEKAKTGGKTGGKTPTPAGMSTGSHDGDQC
ncbi:MAG: hypothetical protein LBV18_01740 [Alistipes sp.]|jgi:hypothetical protein|nr:hypothetical protein [Alistipes sp.]